MNSFVENSSNVLRWSVWNEQKTLGMKGWDLKDEALSAFYSAQKQKVGLIVMI